MVNSVVRAAEILNILSQGRNRITDICQHLNLSKSTAHRLLKTLEQCGFVFQDPTTRLYYLGHLIIKFSSNPYLMHQNLILCAYDELRALRDWTGETTVLFMPIGNKRICLEEVDANQSIKIIVEKGSIYPIHTGSSGKTLLSQFPDDELNKLLDRTPLVRIASNTITNRRVLLREVKKIREQGYATSVSETLDGVFSICVPIRGYFCPAALSVVGPKIHLESRIQEIQKFMKVCAARISKQIKEKGHDQQEGL
jgi:IclR family transcriptional regulator, KDG regulon repressor